MKAAKTIPTKVSVKSFIDLLSDETKRSDARTLVRLMQDATGEKPRMWGSSIIGFGKYHYKYDSGREGDMPMVSFSPRQAAIVFYGLKAAQDHQQLLSQLGSHRTGKGCIYIKRLGDVDEAVLKTLIVNSVAAYTTAE